MRNSYERRRSFRIFCCLCSSKLCLKYAMAEGTGCSQLRAKAGEEERVRKTSLSGVERTSVWENLCARNK